jgi:hypothetical protein
MTQTRALFDRVLADEPPLALTLEPVVAAGRRVRRRRRTAYAATAASLAAVAVAAVLPVSGDGAAVRPVPPAAPAVPARQQVDPALTAEQRAVAQAIVDSSPAGWRFDFSADRWEGASLEGTVDDGQGEVRLLVGVSTATQLLRPCQDEEFGAGPEVCTERPQPDGSVLSTRTTIYPPKDMVHVTAVLTHPDGSGVFLESGNGRMTWPVPEVRPPQEKRDLYRAVREAPVYTEQTIGELALAVDRALRGVR